MWGATPAWGLGMGSEGGAPIRGRQAEGGLGGKGRRQGDARQKGGG